MNVVVADGLRFEDVVGVKFVGDRVADAVDFCKPIGWIDVVKHDPAGRRKQQGGLG